VDEVRLRRFLKRHQRLRLPPLLALGGRRIVCLRDLAHQACKRQLPKKQLRRALVPSDLPQRDCPWPARACEWDRSGLQWRADGMTTVRACQCRLQEGCCKPKSVRLPSPRTVVAVLSCCSRCACTEAESCSLKFRVPSSHCGCLLRPTNKFPEQVHPG